MNTEPLRRPPFDHWPLHRATPNMLLWRPSPGTLVTQAVIECATLAAMEDVSTGVDLLLEHDRPPEGGILIFHDWRRFQRYESSAREHLLRRMRSRPKGYVRKTVVVVPPTPLWRMAIAGANLIYAFLDVSAPEVHTDIVKARSSAQLYSAPAVGPDWFVNSAHASANSS